MSGDQRPAPLSVTTRREESLQVPPVPEDSLAGDTGRLCEGRVSREAPPRIGVAASAPSMSRRQWVESRVRRSHPVGLSAAVPVAHWMDTSPSKLQGSAMGVEASRAAVHGVAESDSAELTRLSTPVFTQPSLPSLLILRLRGMTPGSCILPVCPGSWTRPASFRRFLLGLARGSELLCAPAAPSRSSLP